MLCLRVLICVCFVCDVLCDVVWFGLCVCVDCRLLCGVVRFVFCVIVVVFVYVFRRFFLCLYVVIVIQCVMLSGLFCSL